MSDVKAGGCAHSNGHVYQWITDRQPTTIDANGAGAVRIRKYPNGSSSASVHWSFIGPGVPWQHCNDWTGQDPDRYVDTEGNEWHFDAAINDWELVSSVPTASTLLYVRRQFLSISRSFGPQGQHYIDAVASDGTAWYQDVNPGGHSWRQHDSLPESI